MVMSKLITPTVNLYATFIACIGVIYTGLSISLFHAYLSPAQSIEWKDFEIRGIFYNIEYSFASQSLYQLIVM